MFNNCEFLVLRPLTSARFSLAKNESQRVLATVPNVLEPHCEISFDFEISPIFRLKRRYFADVLARCNNHDHVIFRENSARNSASGACITFILYGIDL